MSDTPIYQAVADEMGFDPSKMAGINRKLTSFEGMKKRSKSETKKV